MTKLVVQTHLYKCDVSRSAGTAPVKLHQGQLKCAKATSTSYTTERPACGRTCVCFCSTGVRAPSVSDSAELWKVEFLTLSNSSSRLHHLHWKPGPTRSPISEAGLFLCDVRFVQSGQPVLGYLSVHGVSVLVTHAFVHEAWVADPLRLGSLGSLAAVHDGGEALSELLGEEAVDDGIHAAVGRAPPLSDGYDDLEWKITRWSGT